MKKLIVICLSLVTLTLYGQSAKLFEQSFRNYVTLNNAETILIPISWDDNGKIGEIKVMGNFRTKNIFFYNAVTEEQTFLFEEERQIISNYSGDPLKTQRHKDDTIHYFSDDYLFYSVIKEDYNLDQKLSNADPTYLYCSYRDGTKLTALTPKSYHVKNYRCLENSSIILATLIADDNGDKKFNDKDSEVLYRVDLKDPKKSKIITKINLRDTK